MTTGELFEKVRAFQRHKRGRVASLFGLWHVFDGIAGRKHVGTLPRSHVNALPCMGIGVGACAAFCLIRDNLSGRVGFAVADHMHAQVAFT